MKIVYLIGNGFDLNLGMKTKYTDFYDYYKTIDAKSENIKFLKEAINNDLVNWSDLELALGDYTKHLTSLSDFDEVYEDLLDNLAEYLKKQEDEFDFGGFNKDQFCKDIISPENSLAPLDREYISNFKGKWKHTSWSINVITFNYTRSLEKLFNNNIFHLTIGKNNGFEIYLSNVFHIHGYHDDRMIMGINDENQMANEDFRKKREIAEALIKTVCNKVYKHSIDDKCKSLIENADLICIFGSSLGETDKYWWELIGERLKHNSELIIFKKGEEIHRRRSYKLARTERDIREAFLSKTSLTDDEKSQVAERVYVSVSSNFFSNILKP